MIPKADIVFLNYQYVLDPHISNMLLPYLNNSNNILLFDEGHNIESIICENHSILLTQAHLKQSYTLLTQYDLIFPAIQIFKHITIMSCSRACAC